mmetsp:Transcript_88371/g.132451  ORF Transcript_88371/g.132451 Transcript_88371/m.132451 type:complete len:116 (-) Transcript_88371:582-929(-)
MNNEKTADITDILKKKYDDKNILSRIWAKIFNVKKDESIGFGMSKKGMISFKLEDNKMPVKGVVCSTNSDGSEWETEWVIANCDTIARANPDFDGIDHTNIKVKCPKNCVSLGTT